MPWSKRGEGCVGINRECRPINRYSMEHRRHVRRRALELMAAEEAARYEEDTCQLQPLSGVRLLGESDLAVSCCNDYLLMPRRSLAKLRARHQRRWKTLGGVGKMTTLDTYKSWSRRYDWQARALLFDEPDRSDMDYAFLKQIYNELQRRDTLEVEK